MSAAERIEWCSEHPALLWSLHPCEDDGGAHEVANDNAQTFVLLAKPFPHTRGATASTCQGEAQLAQRSEQAGGWGPPPDNGNLASKTKTQDGELEVTSFAFDVRDHLRSINYQVGASPPTPVGSYDYDADGRRVRADSPDHGAVEYFYSGADVIEERAPDGEALARHYAGLGALAVDDLTVVLGSRKYIHTDALGTTSHLTDSDGETAASYMVDEWGRPRSEARYPGGFVHSETAEALSPSAPGTDRNRRLFTGHEYDSASGLHYMRARYMDPETGTCLSRDSYLGEAGNPASLHGYMYAHHRPTVLVDPTGHFGIFKDAAEYLSGVVGQHRADFVSGKLTAAESTSVVAGGSGQRNVGAEMAALNFLQGAAEGVNFAMDFAYAAVMGGTGSTGPADYEVEVQATVLGASDAVGAMERRYGDASARSELASTLAGDAWSVTTGVAGHLARKATSGDLGDAYDLFSGAGGLALGILTGSAASRIPTVAKVGASVHAAARAGAKLLTAEVVTGARRVAAHSFQRAGAVGQAFIRGAAPHMGLGGNGGNLNALYHGAKAAAQEVRALGKTAGQLSDDGARLGAGGGVGGLEQLRAKYGRIGDLDGRINARAGLEPRTARAAEVLGDTGDNATVLSRNLALEGRPVGPGQAAGHLVPSTGSKGHWAPGADARELLQHYGIRINSGANGIPIGHPRPHNLTHRGVFLRDLESRLSGVSTSMEAAGYGHRAIRSALQRELRTIGQGVPK